MTRFDAFQKRSFDLVLAAVGLVFLWPLILLTIVAARFDTGASGVFRQSRVGRNGKLFTVLKLRTMRDVSGTTVTTTHDARITPLGRQFRRFKLDELPQLWNVLRGDMSFVGPRPDVPGFGDKLEGADRKILELRPGITGPATLKYRNEEEYLAKQDDPETYNKEVIWPDKVRINLEYRNDWRLSRDLQYIFRTVFG